MSKSRTNNFIGNAVFKLKNLFFTVAILVLFVSVCPRADAQASYGGLSRLHFVSSPLRAVSSHFKLEEGVICYNPTPREATVKLTFYTANAEPTVIEQKMKPNGKTWCKGYPNEAWGLKIESSEPIAAQVFCEHFYFPWNEDFTHTPEFERAYNQYSAMSVTSAAKLFYLPDITMSPNPETLTTVEKQWFTVINPNKTAAKVKLTDNMGKAGTDSREITVPAERISHFDMTEIGLKRFEGGSIIVESDQPAAVMQTRTIEGTDKGKFNNVRFSVFSFMLPGCTMP